MSSTPGTHNQITGGLFLAPVIQGQHVVLHLPAQITPAMAGLPAASASFTGRTQEVTALLEILAPAPPVGGAVPGPGGVVLVTAVGGMGGIR